jgi:hypothetical protein
MLFVCLVGWLVGFVLPSFLSSSLLSLLGIKKYMAVKNHVKIHQPVQELKCVDILSIVNSYGCTFL